MKLFLFIIPFILWLLGCTESERYSNNPKAHLSFSTDTVQFDTVFTTIGTITHQFKFYNRSNEALKTNISLAGGSNSYYRINIDGESTRSINNYEILSNDSVFIFVEATINPQNSNIPMVITDSILFNTNGNQQNVKIVAFGQDVHLYNDSVINSQTWINDKPYLIYHSILVNKHETLTIKEGVQIHFHNESGMIIEGNLNVQGTAEKRVLFQGDRLDQDYKYNPSQWYLISRNERKEIPVGGLFFMPGSKNNVINHAIIKNGAVGIDLFDTIQYDYLKLTLSNSVIENMSNIGIRSQFSNTLVYNSVIANCREEAALLWLGGNHEFYHTTIGNFYDFDKRESPAVAFNNYNRTTNKTYDFNAIFGNCIIDGNLDNEFYPDLRTNSEVVAGFLFDHCMIKLAKDFDVSNQNIFKDLVPYQDSLFLNTYIGNFHLDSASAAINKGSTIYSNLIPFDQDKIDRTTDTKPDLGAYEYTE